MFSWCIYMCNRGDYIGLSPTTEPIWIACTGITKSICNVRSIIVGVFQHLVLNKISLINVKYEGIIFTVQDLSLAFTYGK